MIGKARFENDVWGVIKEYQSKVNNEEMAGVLRKLANTLAASRVR